MATMLAFGAAHAQTPDPRPTVDPVRQHERYVIEPGAEELLAGMLGRGETLPGGCTMTEGQIDRTAVDATYTCGGTVVGLRLLHPENAPSGAVHTQRFAVVVRSGTPPAGLVEAVADRARAREATFEWTELSGPPTRARRWLVPVAAGALLAMLAWWALRRRAARRRRVD